VRKRKASELAAADGARAALEAAEVRSGFQSLLSEALKIPACRCRRGP